MGDATTQDGNQLKIQFSTGSLWKIDPQIFLKRDNPTL